MQQLAFTIALAGLMIDGSAWGTDFLCPPGEGGTLETLFSGKHKTVRMDQWEHDTSYFGPLQEVSVTKFYNTPDSKWTGTTKSIVACKRSIGNMMISTSRTCRLIEGNGAMKTVASGKAMEMTNCTFKSPETNNDHACMVVCEP
jgi:hypothetical protein